MVDVAPTAVTPEPLAALTAWGRLIETLNVTIPAKLAEAQRLLGTASRILG